MGRGERYAIIPHFYFVMLVSSLLGSREAYIDTARESSQSLRWRIAES